jgi:hypothetical protein
MHPFKICNKLKHFLINQSFSGHQCRKTTFLSCNIYLINAGVEKRSPFKFRLEF